MVMALQIVMKVTMVSYNSGAIYINGERQRQASARRELGLRRILQSKVVSGGAEYAVQGGTHRGDALNEAWTSADKGL